MSSRPVRHRAREELTNAEHRILALVAQAAHDADYGAIDLLSSTAAALHEMASRYLSGADASVVGDECSAETSPQFHRALEGPKIDRDVKPRQRQRKVKKSRYPRYEIQDRALYQIGWSKKTRKEYVHKVPERNFERIVNEMQGLAKTNGGPSRTELVSEGKSLRQGDPVPVYHVYAVLGFLRTNDIVRRVGREGHVIPADVAKQASALWQRISLGEIS